MNLTVTDLRIGNLVVYPKWHRNGNDRFFKVRDLFFEQERIGLTTGIIQTQVDFKVIQPIEITEQWLLDFGFDNLGEYGFGIGKFHMVNRVGKWGFPIDGEIRFIKFIHELQNLYFALTGNELKLKD